ncbi:MAG: DUF433 domain-containing protein [Acidobacteriota bacterium]|nr:DUF433 domain-containing protein [Acidobacteriota bacterium]
MGPRYTQHSLERFSRCSERFTITDEAQLLSRITVNPNIFGGRPIIRGMRIKVETILALLEQGVSEPDILDDYPDLEQEDIRACLAYARALVANETLEPVTVPLARILRGGPQRGPHTGSPAFLAKTRAQSHPVRAARRGRPTPLLCK